MKHLLSFSKMFESRHVTPRREQIKDYTLLATNTCSYYYSHDDTATDYNLKRVARIFHDNNDVLWLEIREEGSVQSPYINKEEWPRDEELYFGKVGTLIKPDLNKVRTLLSPETGNAHHSDYQGGYGFMKNPRFASPFHPNKWKDANNTERQGLLSDILKYYTKSTSNVTGEESTKPEKNRDEMIEEIGIAVQKMSDEQLKKIHDFFSLTSNIKKMMGPEQKTKINISGLGGNILNNPKPPEIVQYSERAFAVFGNTIDIKDQLSHLGGRYNRFLTNPNTKQREAGWIFPNGKKTEVEDILKK